MSGKDPTRPLTLLQLSDTHLHAAEDSRMRGVTTYRTFVAALEHARADSRWPADAVVVTGDIVQDESRAGYERYRDTMATLGIPVWCVPGNHDDPKLMDKILAAAPFKVGGDVRMGSWSIVLLNTFLTGEDAGGLGEARLDGLRAALESNANQHVLICMHHHPLPMGSAWLDGVALRDAQPFFEIVDAYSSVRAVVCGHVHQESDRDRNGVRFLSTPSTCAQFWPRSDFFALDNRPPGLRWLKLEPDGALTTEVAWAKTAVPA
jgi:Icc protein